MPAHVAVENLAILDELQTRMRRTAARVAALASEKAGDAVRPRGLREAAEALSRFVPELGPVAEELAGRAPGGAGDSPGMPEGPADEDAPGVSGEAEDLSGVDTTTLVLGARALVSKHKEAGDEPSVERARKLWHLVSSERLDATGAPAGEGGATDPAATAAWIRLSAELWAAAAHVRYLDAIEKAYYNGTLLGQTDDGAGVVGRTLDGEPGEADDLSATPAVATALAEAAGHVLTTDADGGLVAGMSANSCATLSAGGECRLRVLVQTQIPVRGWTCWVFEPLKEAGDPAGGSGVTRRTARRQRGALSAALSGPLVRGEGSQENGPPTFAFRVRVPKWAAFSGPKPGDDPLPGRQTGGRTQTGSRRRSGPGVKIDGRPASVRREGGFYRFDIPTDRPTKIEVILDIGPWILDRKSPVSWGGEVAVGYGPLLLTALSRLNPGEDLSMPLRIVSEAGDLELVGDIRRRLPVVQAKALGGGGRPSRVLFAPVSEVGGFSFGDDTGPGAAPVRCQRFRTWHRKGR